ncbi:hypothetical protein NA78x_000689 [Anatilimnocola sp. NA78]|uniref:hypothetical protein n=1 Tax=Anatilimnocola sp. NA78 TaxID=3415683 RepID=UPI003CE53045
MLAPRICSASLLALVAAVALAGCNTASGPPSYTLTGDITFDNQPIPKGQIVFTPDSSQGNSGPQGVATIQGGKFDTSKDGGSGIGGGPTRVRVTGQAEDGKLLCEYEYSVELPKQSSTLEIKVPASAANRKPPTPEI